MNISETLAKRLWSVWNLMLARAGPEYQSKLFVCVGTWIQFDIPGKPGVTQYPHGESVMLFIDLFSRLKDYCKLPPAYRHGFMKAVEDQATNLENYLKEHPVK